MRKRHETSRSISSVSVPTQDRPWTLDPGPESELKQRFCVAAVVVVLAVPIQLTTTGKGDGARYDFDDAFAIMENMEGLSREVSTEVESATQHDIAAVGAELLRVIPNLISKQLSTDHGAGTSEIQLFEIESALRHVAQGSAANRASKTLPEMIPEGSPKSR